MPVTLYTPHRESWTRGRTPYRSNAGPGHVGKEGERTAKDRQRPGAETSRGQPNAPAPLYRAESSNRTALCEGTRRMVRLFELLKTSRYSSSIHCVFCQPASLYIGPMPDAVLRANRSHASIIQTLSLRTQVIYTLPNRCFNAWFCNARIDPAVLQVRPTSSSHSSSHATAPSHLIIEVHGHSNCPQRSRKHH